MLNKVNSPNNSTTTAITYINCCSAFLAMAKYRIKEYDYGTGKNYVVQRRSIFGFWYNPDNIDGCTTGWYDSMEEAKEVINKKMTPTKTKVVWGG